ncbi:MAG: RICIN domain-containing protein [Actinomycetota bacterium]|nr:RICIN domain-containing protein [Actinomycetota bacterium]
MAARSFTRRGNAVRALAVAAAIATGSVVAAIRPADPQTGPQGEEIVSPLSGLVMDVAGASTAEGASVIQWESNEGNNQKWLLKQFGTFGGSPLVLIQSVHSRRVLDAMNGSNAQGTQLVQRTWTGTPSQWWVVYRIGESDFDLLLNVNSIQVADIERASLDPGAPIIQWPWHAGVNQIWLTPEVIVPPITTSTTSGATTTTTSGATTTTTMASTTSTTMASITPTSLINIPPISLG